ncbi:MAG TPA: nitrilase-related carbon-nitrogen hydrolase [Puia sp.]|jgi:apolipoprotein N-acyltransferase|nr:nitrilase-related carbon-nitrogen hydrolase [Puia sp.]
MKQRTFWVGVLAAAVVSAVLSSPKFGVGILAWVCPICLLAFFRLAAVRRKAVWAFPALMLAHYLAGLDVAPFPAPVLLLLCIYQSLVQLALYGADAWVFKRFDGLLMTLFFPSFAVGLEFLNTVYGGGIWWSVANSQYELGWLVQLASVTGIWGISFLLYWTASVAVWVLGRRKRGGWIPGLTIYGVVMSVIIVTGCIRYRGVGGGGRSVKVAGVSVSLMGLYETFYSDYSGRKIVVNPRGAVTDPVMGLVGQAEAAYVETADTVRFGHVAAAIRAMNDSLFALSQRAVDRGARIVSWSEGNGIGWAAEGAGLVEKGRRFAAQNKVYLLMTLCLVHPGKITPGRKFLENEAVLLGPDGKVLTVFHKNNPVPMVEASQPGNGIIPVVQTPYGKLAVSICYDADQVGQMRQLGHKDADLLLLPSGDWYAISPFHTYMAVYRGIENGCSVFREVSNGLSIATDNRGRPVGSRDYFRDGASYWLVDLPVGHANTIYSRIGDVLPYGCMVYILFTVAGLLFVRSRRPDGPLETGRMALQP